MDATLTFSLFFNMLLGPFVSAVLALVRVLELFNVDDYWFALVDRDAHSRTIPCPAGQELSLTRCSRPSLNIDKLLALQLNGTCVHSLGSV